LRGPRHEQSDKADTMLMMMATARSWLRAGNVCYCPRLHRRGRRSLVLKDAFVGRAIYRLIFASIYEPNIALPAIALGTWHSGLRLEVCLDLGW
jgi:hypothetical protein